MTCKKDKYSVKEIEKMITEGQAVKALCNVLEIADPVYPISNGVCRGNSLIVKRFTDELRKLAKDYPVECKLPEAVERKKRMEALNMNKNVDGLRNKVSELCISAIHLKKCDLDAVISLYPEGSDPEQVAKSFSKEVKSMSSSLEYAKQDGKYMYFTVSKSRGR